MNQEHKDLLTKGVESWNIWLEDNPDVRPKLSGANLNDADLNDAYLRGADLRGTNLFKADLIRADLKGADLTGADLTGADLGDANLSGANLSGADFTGADLRGANLNGAIVKRANFTGVDISGTDLRNTNCNDVIAKAEKEPDGIDQHAAGAKLDDGKIRAAVLEDFSLALLEVAKVGNYGATKYSRGGWQSVENGLERYSDAFWRHLLEKRHSEIDKESGLTHISQMAWNLLAIIELQSREKE
jgi:hypothetical protein